MSENASISDLDIDTHLNCIICRSNFNSPEHLFAHLNTHDGSITSCQQCSCDFNNEHAYNHHLVENMCNVKDKKVWQCGQCNANFRGHIHLIKHLEGHKVNNCPLCPELLSTRQQHVLHMHQAHNILVRSEKIQCSHCDKRFSKKLQLFHHCKNHHASKLGLEVCMKCGVFLNKDDVNVHAEIHEKERHWKCTVCNETFSRSQQYIVHLKALEKYKCDLCNVTFCTKLKMLDHGHKIHQQVLLDSHICQICNSKFSRPGQLKAHYKNHAGEKPFYCNICKKNFTAILGYKKHLKSLSHLQGENNVDGNSDALFTCDKCSKSFRTKAGLIKHLEQPHWHKCDFCNFETTSKDNAKRHMTLHTGVRPFICEHCGAAFFTMSNLQDHFQYVHTIERTFKCTKCKAAFKTKSSLNRHLRTHSDQRPYGCHCGQTYKRPSHLQRHQNSAHGPVKPKRVTRLRRDESGAVVPVEEEKKNARDKPKRELKPKSGDINLPNMGLVSLFITDSGQLFTLQPLSATIFPPTNSHENVGINSFKLGLPDNQTMQISTPSIGPTIPSINPDHVSKIDQTVEQQYDAMQITEPVEMSLLDSLVGESYFTIPPDDHGDALSFQG